MRIGSRLSLNSGIVFAMLCIMILAVLWAFQEAQNAHSHELLITEINSTFDQMSVLRDEYLLRQEERAKMQWRAKAEQSRKLLEQAGKQLTDTHERMILNEIRRTLDLSMFLFSSLTEYFNNTENIKKRFFALESRRMLSQILANSYTLISTGNNLLASVQKRSGIAREKTMMIVIFLMVLAVLITIGNSWSINRTLSKRIALLSEGAQAIGNGNLGHQIAVEGNDELTDLAAANNKMAMKLMNSYTTVDILEKEIDERKRAEEALSNSERKYRNIFENATEGIFQSTPEGRYISVNPAFARIGGYDSPDEMINSVSDIQKKMYVHPEDRARLLGLFRQQGIINNFEAEIRSRDNAIIWISMNVKTVRDQVGKIILLEGTIVDITERKRAEDEIRQLNAELEQRVAARTADLAEKARQMETFTYSVSHDLKTPLRGIDGYSRLLLEDYSERLDQEGRTFLNNIRRATEQMGHIIEGLLTYSRMERRSLASQDVHPLALVQALLAERIEEIDTGKVRVTVEMPDVVIKTDPEGLNQVLRNLLDNAIKFTGKTADPHIEIGGEEKEKTCLLWVRDNGIGFDMQYHDRIFGIFQRLQKLDDYSGTGIGLAIVQKAMQRMGGKVWAESTPGKGATFYLEVPK
jgi:PAS domain S-box-containing protein